MRCFCEDEEYSKLLNEFTDSDELELTNSMGKTFQFPTCPITNRVFQLVRMLVHRFQEAVEIDHPPVPTNLITRTDDGFPIEVRQVPLKAYRGAVWKLPNCWVVQLNSNNSPARQRFTLFHEIFHILAHSKAIPVFKKASSGREGFFNEILADHFAAVCLLPEKWVKEMWPKVKDVNKMAEIFNVPKPVVWFALKHLGLI